MGVVLLFVVCGWLFVVVLFCCRLFGVCCILFDVGSWLLCVVFGVLAVCCSCVCHKLLGVYLIVVGCWLLFFFSVFLFWFVVSCVL